MHAIKQTALLLAFAGVGGAIGYLIAMRSAERQHLEMFYASTSTEARVTASALTMLRTGNTDKATRFLEADLTSNLISLTYYEKDIPAAMRDKSIYEGVAKVREYYTRFPEAKPSPYAVDGLALGSPLPHNAP